MNPDSKPSALLALLLMLPVPAIGAYIALAGESTQGTPLGWTIYMLSKAWILLFPVLWLLFVDKRKLSLSPVRRGGLRAGVVLGLAMAGAIVLTYFLARGLIDVEQMKQANAAHGLGSSAAYLALVVPLALINSLLEEYVWRWFVFRKCEVLVGGVPAAFLGSLLFAGHHVIALKSQMNWDVTLLASLGVFLAGAVWSLCYLKYRSIWPGYFSHVFADIAIFAIGWWVMFGNS